MFTEFTSVQSAFILRGTYKKHLVRLEFVRNEAGFWKITAIISPTKLHTAVTLRMQADEPGLENLMQLLEDVVRKHRVVLAKLKKEVRNETRKG